jgi:hypothetical protein
MKTIEAPPTMIMRVPSDLSSTQLLKLPFQYADGGSPVKKKGKQQDHLSCMATHGHATVEGEVAISLPFEIIVQKKNQIPTHSTNYVYI